MTTINISIGSTGMDQTQAAALAYFLNSLGTTSAEVTEQEPPVQMPTTTEIVEAQKTTRQRPKKEKASEPEEAKDLEPEEIKDIEVKEPETVEAEEKPITLQEIRSLVFVKKDAHKDAIKAELKRIGADSIPNVQPKDYPAFHKFLEGLE